jgi:hypothetical protein
MKTSFAPSITSCSVPAAAFASATWETSPAQLSTCSLIRGFSSVNRGTAALSQSVRGLALQSET